MSEKIQKSGGREMPYHESGERGLVCSMFLQPDVIEECGQLPDGAFWHPVHASLYDAMTDLREKSQPVDFVTLAAALQRRDGGAELVRDQAALISEITAFLPTASNWRYYRDLVLEHWQKRRIIHELTELISKAYQPTTDGQETEELLNEVEATLLRLRQAQKADEAMQHCKVHLLEAVNRLDAVYRSRGKPSGLATGWADLDRQTSGLKPGQLWIVAGRPSMGKSVIGMQMALHIAKELKVPVAFFSLEMTGAELAERLLGGEANLNLQRWRDGFMTPQDPPRIFGAARTLSEAPLYIDETSGLSVFDFKARARRAVVRHGVKCVVVDYLQLMTSTSRRAQMSRAIEVAEISMALKSTAKELGIPVIALAQLNRDADGKERRPTIANLRESGQIEQDADVVLLIHRPHKDDKEMDKSEGEPAELIIGKQRNGPIGPIDLMFKGHVTRFDPVTERLYSNNPDQKQRRD